MTEKCFTIICSVISFLLSLLASAISYKIKHTATVKREKYFNFYYPFCILRDGIHQAQAFDFSDLPHDDREKIMSFLIEHGPYADAELSEQIYTLKCSRLDNFNDMDVHSVEAANRAYNIISDIMADKEKSLRKKYI